MTVNWIMRVVGSGVLAAMVLGLGSGCNERTLFRDTDVASRKVKFYDTYDGQTAKGTADLRKQQSDMGFGPSMFGGGSP